MAPVFEYVTINETGKKTKGVLDADSPAAARNVLRGRGLRTIELKEVAGRRSRGRRIRIHLSRVSNRDLAVVFRRFATLVNSGLPLVESLDALLEQTDQPLLQKVLRRVRERVLEGKPLWEALSEHPNVFNELQVNMVRAGESGGGLEIVLARLAELMESRMELQNKIRTSLAYPLFMFVVGSGVLIFLMAVVIPQVTELFRETGQRLPWPTTLMMKVTGGIQRYWWVGIILVGVVVFFWARLNRSPKGKLIKGRLMLRLPVVGSMETWLMVSRFARTLGVLLNSGMPLLSGLRVARSVVGNPVFVRAIEEVEIRVGEGASLSDPLKRTGLFPPMAVHMIHSGEKSGALEEMMIHVADSYEKEVSGSLALLVALLEPVMILGMGLAVGFIVVAVLLPIFEMSHGIR